MLRYPAVVIRNLNDADAALAPGRGVTLLSAPAAALHAGCSWWRALITRARAAHPDTPADDVLDCADASGLALGALRIGQHIIVLNMTAPGRPALAAIAAARGAVLLSARPPALDLGIQAQRRRLDEWLTGDDTLPPLR